jgi:hypothetical protein
MEQARIAQAGDQQTLAGLDGGMALVLGAKC